MSVCLECTYYSKPLYRCKKHGWYFPVHIAAVSTCQDFEMEKEDRIRCLE